MGMPPPRLNATRTLPGPAPRVSGLEVHERGEWLRAVGYVDGELCDIMAAKQTLAGLSVSEVREFLSRMLIHGKVRR